MVLSFFCLLPLGPLKAAGGAGGKELEYESVPTEDDEHVTREDTRDQAGLLAQLDTRDTTQAQHNSNPPAPIPLLPTLHANLLRARYLLLPYMLPLFLVYLAEYTINQGVAPTLLFPLARTPFTHYRDFYPAYATIYQLG
ncbi:battenin CLN3 protein, partial [Friedmanniomyces endolithicus]